MILKILPILIVFVCVQNAFSDTDLYSFPKVQSATIIQQPKKKTVATDPFIKALSKLAEVDESLLAEKSERGFTRRELVRLVVISKKSSTSLIDLFKQRERGLFLFYIAKKAGLDTRMVRRESGVLLKSVEDETEKIQKSEKAIAGTDEVITHQ